jgi:hypothetical protein
MKCKSVSLSCLTVCLCLFPATLFSRPALAQCVMSHVGVQVNMSRNPATQTSNVEMQGPKSCAGNTSSSTSVQVNTDNNGPVRQNQRVRQEIRDRQSNGNQAGGPTVRNSVIVPVNVKTPENFNP